MPKAERWTIVVPIQNVSLSEAVDYEFRIDRVTILETSKLAGRRRKFGIPWRVSEMRAEKHGAFGRFLDDSPIVAIVRQTGSPGPELEKQVTALVRDELAILSASQLGFAKRSQTAAPAIYGERPRLKQSFLWLSQSKAWKQPNNSVGPLRALRLDRDWCGFQRGVFFFKLIDALRGRTTIARSWCDDLRRATVLIGLSQASHSLTEAFLWNMVALELLLTSQGDVVGEALPSRAEALLGWSTNWKEDGFEQKIRRAYQSRCRIVHQGNRGAASAEDLYFTDDLLLCLLVNLVTHPQQFGSKESVAEFSRKVEAEKILGNKRTVRPRSLRMLRRTYRASDYRIFF